MCWPEWTVNALSVGYDNELSVILSNAKGSRADSFRRDVSGKSGGFQRKSQPKKTAARSFAALGMTER
jgi:hypothetical protein